MLFNMIIIIIIVIIIVADSIERRSWFVNGGEEGVRGIASPKKVLFNINDK